MTSSPESRRSVRILVLAALLASACAHAADEHRTTRDGVSLVYRDVTGALAPAMRERIENTFFASYLRERADFNPSAAAKVLIVIDPGYDGIAFVGDDATMTINPAWLRTHPADTDLVAHEAMHIVQAYRGDDDAKVPGWLTEGIADYARDRYGVDNAAGGWALPTSVKPGQRYDSGYRVTGAFLKWAEARHPGLVKRLDAALRDGTYAPSLWRQATGSDVASLWNAYVAALAGAAPAAPEATSSSISLR